MERFNFPFHGNPSKTPEDRSINIELRGGFRFTTKPIDPIIRVFTLTFPAMGYYTLPDGTPDTQGTIEPQHNIAALERFYERHGTWKTFIYPHPFWGDTNVRFNAPFTTPVVTGNQGKVLNIEVVLREHP